METMDKKIGEMMGKMAFIAMEEMPKLVNAWCAEGGWPGLEAPKIMGESTMTADMWEGMLPTWVETGLGKVLPIMEKERVYGLARAIINVVVDKSSSYMTEEAKQALMGSTWKSV